MNNQCIAENGLLRACLLPRRDGHEKRRPQPSSNAADGAIALALPLPRLSLGYHGSQQRRRAARHFRCCAVCGGVDIPRFPAAWQFPVSSLGMAVYATIHCMRSTHPSPCRSVVPRSVPNPPGPRTPPGPGRARWAPRDHLVRPWEATGGATGATQGVCWLQAILLRWPDSSADELSYVLVR